MIHQHQTNVVCTAYPLDQTTIYTSFRINDAVGKCSANNLDALPPHIRSLIRSISESAKSDHRLRPALKSQSPQRYNPKIATRRIEVDGFAVATLHAEELPGAGWYVHKIDFNPGKMVFGHNGRIPDEESFLHALSVLIHLVSQLLADPDDWIHIVPGLDPRGYAWWGMLEIPYHIYDADKVIIHGFWHAKHGEINLKPFNCTPGESITFADADQELLIRVYRKDLQMLKKHGRKLSHYEPVVRIEVRLRKDKLVKHLIEDCEWREINHERRLLSFRPSGLHKAHHAVMQGFHGVYAKLPSAGSDTKQKSGRIIGWIMFRTGLEFDEIFNYVSHRFLVGNTRATVRNQKSALHRAAREEIELLSSLPLTCLAGDEAWRNQPNVIVTKLEAMTQARHRDIRIHPLVEAAYGSRAPIVTNA